MHSLPATRLSDYQYELPEGRIAKYPLANRDQSKLLVWKDGKISHQSFIHLTDLLPVNTTLFFNNTKVIPARILFEKATGGTVEVFLLNPHGSEVLIQQSLESHPPVVWKCAVGNAKRWPNDLTLHKSLKNNELRATWVNRNSGLVQFDWTPADLPFASVVESVGAVPLPPYLNRPAEPSDRDRYQTVYSSTQGAVAAPTAGLHFTPQVMSNLSNRGVASEFLTLHVSAGTFLPVKAENAAEHTMHEEEIILTKANIISLLQQDRTVVAVGTTALRTLESAYWFGTKLEEDPNAPFTIAQDLPYTGNSSLSKEAALNHILRRMERQNVDQLAGHTSLYVLPGYRFRIVQGLITNFHQPGSTLLMLISAFVGPAWKNIYQAALDNDYRFLSYGDSSLLLPNK